MSASPPASPWPADLQLVVLCAAWCRTCDEYRAVLDGLPGLPARWVDIEDEADTVEPLDIETFPTLLIVRAGQPVFFGPVLPQSGVLERLLRQDAAPLKDAAAQGLWQRLQAAEPS
jgi:thioredoxin-like negative regulator of GroEL